MEEFGGDFFFSEGVSFSPPAPTAGGCRAFLFPSPFSLSLFLLYLWQRLQGAAVVRELDPREVLREDLCVGGRERDRSGFVVFRRLRKKGARRLCPPKAGKKKSLSWHHPLASLFSFSLFFLSSLSLSLLSHLLRPRVALAMQHNLVACLDSNGGFKVVGERV